MSDLVRKLNCWFSHTKARFNVITTSTVISHKLWFPVFQPLVKFKNHLYYEEKDSTTEAEKVLKPAPGSKVSISVNELGCFAQLL